MFTTSEWLASLLRRYVRKGHAPNVSLAEDGGIPNIGLPVHEAAVALVRTTDGREYLITSLRVVEDGRTLFRFDEVRRCHWITDHPDTHERTRLKSTHFDRLVLELVAGTSVVLERLDQAVFPLLRFFESIERP